VGHVLTQKIGPLPLVLWVVGGASVVFVVMMMRNKGGSGAQGMQTNQVSALAPTEAEAFGTMEQQQQDVVNALTTLGNNQSALGGSLSTLTGIVTQQGTDNAASFQNLQNGQQTIEQGQQSAASAASNYYSSLLSNLVNYANSLSGQLNGVNSNLQTQINTVGANLSAQQQQQLQQLSGQIASSAQGSQEQYNALYSLGQFLNSALSQVQGNVIGSQQAQYNALYAEGQYLSQQIANK
jgi:hypothetical protein